MLKRFAVLLAVTAAAFNLSGCQACGYKSIDNQMTGQVKKIHHNTPVICPNYDSADVSLGVMQNGVGSISNHDLEVTIEDKDTLKVLEEAAKTGKIVEIDFKVRRETLCIPDHIVTSAKLLDPAAEPASGDSVKKVVYEPTLNEIADMIINKPEPAGTVKLQIGDEPEVKVNMEQKYVEKPARMIEKKIGAHVIRGILVDGKIWMIEINGEVEALDGPVGQILARQLLDGVK